MKFVRFDSSHKALTIAAGLLTIASAISFVRVNENQKPIALSVLAGSASIAVASQSLKLFEDSANNQVRPVIESKNSEITSLSTELTKQSTALMEVRQINERLAKELEQSKQEIKNRDTAITALTNQLASVKLSVDAKLAELQAKIDTDDTRAEDLKNYFKQYLTEDTIDRINYEYDRLMDSVKSRLANEDYQKIHTHLAQFGNSLYGNIKRHREMMTTIAEVDNNLELRDFIGQSLDIYSQIANEITALRVRFRNILNIDERVSLDEAYTLLADFKEGTVPKEKAKDLLSEYSDFSKSQIENLKGHVRDNQNSLDEMRGQVAELLDLIDNKCLEINNLNQKISDLQKPIRWGVATRDDLRMGNVIIAYFEQLGFILDKANSDYRKFEAILTFHVDRNKRVIVPSELNEHSERLQQLAHTLAPIKFSWNAESGVMEAYLAISQKPKKEQESPEEAIKPYLKQPEALIDFVNDAYHIGLWGETGRGKTTAISNIIGGMVQSLGRPTIRTTVPKIDDSTAKIFPHVDWLGVPNSIFGLLEAALEIQFRIHQNEQAFVEGREIKEFDPILFFIDEINLIFTRWGKVNDADLDDVLLRFRETLNGDRLEYFDTYMQYELRNYKSEFAKRLLLFIWQTGRSLKVKSLIAGQNLQPGSFRLMVNDIANCAYISFGSAKHKCLEYKVSSTDLDSIKAQLNLLDKAEKIDSNLQFTGLYCPNVGSSFLGIMPPPNTYEWDKSLLCPQTVQIGQDSPSIMDAGQENVQNRPALDSNQGNTFKPFRQASKLPRKFQKLDYEGCVQLWAQLPKKPNGEVHKLKAYETIFEVSRSTDRKVVSEFIDYLRNICK